MNSSHWLFYSTESSALDISEKRLVRRFSQGEKKKKRLKIWISQEEEGIKLAVDWFKFRILNKKSKKRTPLGMTLGSKSENTDTGLNLHHL